MTSTADRSQASGAWRCPICRQPGRRTAEHVYPRWVSRLLGLDGRRVNLYVGTERRWETIGIGVTVHVCEDCNHGWLHDLEAQVQPILREPILGHPRRFSTADQRLMAAWAVKTATLLEVAQRSVRGVGYVPDGLFDQLRINGEPGPEQRVWIGAVSALLVWPAWTSTTTLVVGRGEGNVQAQGYLAAFLVGHLLFQVFGQDRGGRNDVSLGAVPDASLRRIWPSAQAEISWPTMPVLDPEEIDRIWPPQGDFEAR